MRHDATATRCLASTRSKDSRALSRRDHAKEQRRVRRLDEVRVEAGGHGPGTVRVPRDRDESKAVSADGAETLPGRI